MVFKFVLLPVKVTGTSMSPTYQDGSIHLINKLTYVSEHPRRGDVVALRVDQDEIYLKRIIGLPGEEIAIEYGKIFINGEPLKEPYAWSTIPWRVPPTKLGPHTFYAVGDNRAVTVFGAIDESHILGKLVL